MLELGFQQTTADYSLFTFHNGSYFTVALVYVDDILLNGNDNAFIAHVKSVLHSAFTIKDLGLIKYYLGLEVHRTDQGMFLHQHKFIHDLVLEAGLSDAKPLSLPVDFNIKLSTHEGVLLDNPSLYRKFVGKLLYLSVSRPDITYIVHHLSQFIQTPRVPHMLVVQRVLRYLKGTAYHGLYVSARSNLHLNVYCDSDWGACNDSYRSIIGMCLLLGTSLVSWQSRKQKVVSRSTAEAKLLAIADTSCEISWLFLLLSELHIPQYPPIVIHSDNSAALDIASDPIFRTKRKYFTLDCHFVHEQVQLHLINPVFIPSSLQLIDLMTKSLHKHAHSSLLSRLNVIFSHAIWGGYWNDSADIVVDLIAMQST